MKIRVHLPVTPKIPSSIETEAIDKETTPTQTRQVKTNRISLELELKQHFGISVPLTNAMTKARGFLF